MIKLFSRSISNIYNKRFFFPVVLLIFDTIVYSKWILTIQTLSAGDWMYNYANQAKEYFTLPNTWTDNGFGGIQLTPSFYPFYLLTGLLSRLGLPQEITVRIVFLYVISIIGVLITYYSFNKLFKNSTAGFFSTLVYSFNTYILTLSTGHLTVAAAYVFLPLIFLLYKKTLDTKKFTYALITSLILFIQSYYEFRVTYITLIIIFFYLLFQISASKEKKKTLFYGAVPIVLFLLYNSYWLVGYILSSENQAAYLNVFERGLFGAQFHKVSHIFFQHHSFFSLNGITSFATYKVPFYLSLLSIFLIFGYYRHLKTVKIAIYFIVILLIGIFLTKSSNAPFGDTYQFLYNKFPGFNAYRESSKFMIMITFGYASITGLLFTYSKSKYKYILSILIITSALLNTKIFITGEVDTLFTKKIINSDYLYLRDQLIENKTFYRTLWIPTDSRWGYYDSNHPKLSLVNAPMPDEYKNLSIIESINSKDFISVISNLGVKYIVIPLDDKVNSDDLFDPYKVKRSQIISSIDNLHLKKIDTPSQELIIYENYKFKPLFYLNTNDEISYKRVSPSLYHITLNKNNKDDSSLKLFFNQSYSSNWVALPSHLTEQDLILKRIIKNKLVYSIQSGNSNSFELEPTDAIEYTVFFKAQMYYYYGIIITACVLILLFILLFIKSKTKHKNI